MESVKFPRSVNDVILQAYRTGIVLKSASTSGVIMTRCMIRSQFFVQGSYQIEIRNEEDKRVQAEEGPQPGLDIPLIEFCLPISELKQIVDGIVKDENPL